VSSLNWGVGGGSLRGCTNITGLGLFLYRNSDYIYDYIWGSSHIKAGHFYQMTRFWVFCENYSKMILGHFSMKW